MNSLTFILLLVVQLKFSIAEIEYEGDIALGCRPGSYKFNDFCYSMNSLQGNYDDAIEYCKYQGGELMNVKNANDGLIVQRFIIRNSLLNFWIGLNDKNVEGVWMFGDETPVGNFTAWAPNEPNDKLKSQDCGCLWDAADFNWDDDFCYNKKFFICQFSSSVVDCESRAGSFFNNNCYKIENHLLKYDDADKKCRAMGGSLASIKSKEIFEFIKKLTITDKNWKSLSSKETLSIINAQTKSLDTVWAGLKLINDSWTYNDGSVIKSYTNWRPGEPNNVSPGEDCAAVRDKWNDVNCKVRMSFLCKYNAFENPQSIIKAKTTKNNVSVAGWSNSRLFGLFFAGFLLGLLAPIIYFCFVKFYPKLKNKFSRNEGELQVNIIDGEDN